MKRILIFLLCLLAACPAKVTPPTPPTPFVPGNSNVVAVPPPAPEQAPIPPTNKVSLCWDASPSPEVLTYGVYQDAIQVQEVADHFTDVDGLVAGRMYSFYVTAKGFDQDDNAIESDPSNTLKYIVPVLTLDATGIVRFNLPETNYLANQSFILESTTNLASTNWTSETYSVTDGTNATFQADITQSAQKFFRVHVSFGGATGCK